MKAPVDYPLNASTLLEELQGDELTHLSMLDRIEASTPPNEARSGQTAPNTSLKRRRIIVKPAIIDAPMSANSTV